MERTCSMIGCNNTNDNLSADHFFQFPSDFDLCLTWVENCKTPQIFEDFVFGGALPCLKRFMCYHHFSTDDFVDPERINLGLKPSAVPHYFPLKQDQRWEECYIKDEVCCEDNDESWEDVIDNETNEVDNYIRTWTDPTTATTPNEEQQETKSRYPFFYKKRNQVGVVLLLPTK
uniref:THAP-type domain-containing protein n=1 Tax=Photinus pyralis TaxID=7054 RepID=A0A1Y1MT91_PHOPY